ncbi:MAG: hypothetical protein AAF557_05015 [Pseudomonadota bacterium]
MARLIAWPLALCFAIALGPVPTQAHLFDEGVSAALIGVEAGETGSQNVSLLIINSSPLAVTLRRITTRDGSPVKIERARTFLWTKTRQAVKFLRFSPGEQIFLAPPEYFVTVPGVEATTLLSGKTRLVADFGPEGQIDVSVVGPVGGLMGEPAWDTLDLQTTE